MLSFALTSFALLSLVAAGTPPYLHYPLQSQLPPVARVNKTFLWTLLPDTFLSGTSMSYSAQDMPDWLSFDANTLTFMGTPGSDDIGNNYVVVQANASDSTTGTQSGFHCLVTNEAAPEVGASVANQLSDGRAVFSSSYLQTDGTIRIPPTWSFSIGFQQYTFTDPNGGEIYYAAYRADTTSLPNWLTFDNTTVTFDGLAPSNENSFDIVLHGSDEYGYSDVTQTFTLVIGSHSFVLADPLPSINSTAKEEITYNIPISGLRLDGDSISAGNLSSVSVDLGNNSYLSYNSASRTITGSLPSELPSTSDIHLPVTFVDIYNDTVIANITLHIIAQLFANSSLPNYNITGGKSFTDDLSSYLISSASSYTASFTPSNASDWLQFDNTTRRLSGTPPAVDGQDIFINITGQDAASGVTESAGLHLLYTDATQRLHQGAGGLSNGAKIAIAVIFGILGGLILLGIILFLCRRYCGKDEHSDNDAVFAAVAAEKGKTRSASPISNARLSDSSSESDRLSEAIAEAAEMSIANALARERQQQQQQPRRMDLLNLFGGAKRSDSSNNNLASGQSGRSVRDILGLSPSKRREQPDVTEARRHDIVVVTDGDGYTYRPSSAQGTASGSGHGEMSGARSEGTRSSFDSHQSSSLFYSEESGSYTASPVQRPRLAHTRDGTPRSVPRQRKDFLPFQASPAGRNMSPSPSRMPSGGIRLVQPNRESGLSITESDEAYNADSVDHGASIAADAAIATAHLEQLASRNSSYSRDSRATSRPRLIPFTSEHRGERADSLPERRYPSQKVLPSANDSAEIVENETSEADLTGPPDESTQDADEHEASNRYSAMSVPYYPTLDEDSMSPIIYNRESVAGPRASPLRQEWSASPTKSAEGLKSNKSRTMVNSMIVDPLRIQLGSLEPFHFTAQVHPPPAASIGSPGRDGPPRSSYYAYTDYPDEPDFDGLPLPDWLHFDPRELEFWGTPEASDAGSIAVRVVERKHFQSPASPSRQRQSGDSRWSIKNESDESEDVEQIVGRFVLDVTDRRATVGSLGEVVGITY